MDGYNEPVQLQAALTVHDDRIHVDYEGTSVKSGPSSRVSRELATSSSGVARPAFASAISLFFKSLNKLMNRSPLAEWMVLHETVGV